MARINLVILATFICGSLSQPAVKTWTLNEISTALELHRYDDIRPHLEDALNKIMYALFTGKEEEVLALLRSPTGDKLWTRDELAKAVQEDTNPDYTTYIMNALQYLRNMDAEGNHHDTVEVPIPALDLSVWTIEDVDKAETDPKTSEILKTHLKEADVAIQNALNAGEAKERVRVTLVTAVGVVPLESGVVPDIIPRTKVNTI